MANSGGGGGRESIGRRTFIKRGLVTPAVFPLLASSSYALQPVDKPLLVFLPGILGSTLRSGDQDIFPADAYKLYKVLIEAPNLLRWNQTPATETAVLESVELWPWWVWPGLAPFRKYGVYDKILETLQSIAQAQGMEFFPFPYDWRQDLFHTVGQLRQDLHVKLGLNATTDAGRHEPARSDRDVYLVGHSMGALIAVLAMLERVVHPDNVRQLILIAPPLGGSPKAFRTTYDATQFLFLKQLYRIFWFVNGRAAWRNFCDVIQSCPSIYQIMPPHRFGQAPRQDYVFLRSLGKWINPWERGVFDPALIAGARRLHDCLDQGLADFPVPKKRTHLLLGNEIATDIQYHAEELAVAGGPKRFEIEQIITSRTGDGTVLESSADRINHFGDVANKYCYTAAEHVGMCRRNAVLQQLNILLQARP